MNSTCERLCHGPPSLVRGVSCEGLSSWLPKASSASCHEGMQGRKGLQGHVLPSPDGCREGLPEGVQGHNWPDLTGLCRVPQGCCEGMQCHKGSEGHVVSLPEGCREALSDGFPEDSSGNCPEDFLFAGFNKEHHYNYMPDEANQMVEYSADVTVCGVKCLPKVHQLRNPGDVWGCREARRLFMNNSSRLMHVMQA